jgi:hypothetical protein
MRKLCRTRSRTESGAVVWMDRESRPRGTLGATVNARPIMEFDLTNSRLSQPTGATVTANGAALVPAPLIGEGDSETKETVSLADGTRIIFATTGL